MKRHQFGTGMVISKPFFISAIEAMLKVEFSAGYTKTPSLPQKLSSFRRKRTTTNSLELSNLSKFAFFKPFSLVLKVKSEFKGQIASKFDLACLMHTN
jgi:hypothetical protein